ncbi:hypothetical protein CPLU01_03165 [Colletotrichum plurivorum]|uniref:Uncharacterized protein n=1 Tax=Colletotrichum plurivorum TaxID=2175906 RepID=A0A8H6NLZ0_9PEZI|nr:hypothetical protein CPLU01_03165 [Colletotrichum plurivorum]
MFRGEKRKRENTPARLPLTIGYWPPGAPTTEHRPVAEYRPCTYSRVRYFALTLPPFSLAFALSHRTALPALHHRWCKHRDAPLGPQRRAKNFNTTPPGIQPGGDGGEAKGVRVALRTR